MAGKGQRNIERLLDKYAQHRQAQAGQPMDLHMIARNELQAEITKHYGRGIVTSQEAAEGYAKSLAWQQGLERWWHKMVPWIGFAGMACVALIVAFIAANHRSDEGPAALGSSSDFLQVAQADLESESEEATASESKPTDVEGLKISAKVESAPTPTAAPSVPTTTLATAKTPPTITAPLTPDASEPIAETETETMLSRLRIAPPVGAMAPTWKLDSARNVRKLESEEHKMQVDGDNKLSGSDYPVLLNPNYKALPPISTAPASELRPVASSTPVFVPAIASASDGKRSAAKAKTVTMESSPMAPIIPEFSALPVEVSKEISPAGRGGSGALQDRDKDLFRIESLQKIRSRAAVPSGTKREKQYFAKAESIGSPKRVAYSLSSGPVTAPTGTHHFIQFASYGGFRRNLTVSPERQVMGAFDLRISGQKVTIKDGDGSIYNGSMLPGGSVGEFKLTIKGLHRSSKQRVEFTGTYGPGPGIGERNNLNLQGGSRRSDQVVIKGQLTLDGKVRSQIQALKQR